VAMKRKDGAVDDMEAAVELEGSLAALGLHEAAHEVALLRTLQTINGLVAAEKTALKQKADAKRAALRKARAGKATIVREGLSTEASAPAETVVDEAAASPEEAPGPEEEGVAVEEMTAAQEGAAAAEQATEQAEQAVAAAVAAAEEAASAAEQMAVDEEAVDEEVSVEVDALEMVPALRSLPQLWAATSVLFEALVEATPEATLVQSTLGARVLALLEAFCVASELLPVSKEQPTAAPGAPAVAPVGNSTEAALGLSGLPSLEELGPLPDVPMVRSTSMTLFLQGSQGTSTAQSSATMAFLHKHRRLVNAVVRQTPSLLEDSLKLFATQPRFLDFDNKRGYFHNRLKKQERGLRRGQLPIRVPRSDVFGQSFQQMRFLEPANLRGRLNVTFDGEEAVDAGGVSREWYSIVSREMFKEHWGLFLKSHESMTYQPNYILETAIGMQEEYQNSLQYFTFVGRVIGKAVYDGQLMDVRFTRSFYKHMLGISVSLADMEAFDPQYHKSLKLILENDLDNLGLDMNFTVERERVDPYAGYAKTIEVVPLKEGGENIAVTEQNKAEYVKLVCDFKLAQGIRTQIDAFLKGFHDIIPKYIDIFNEQELELLISGLPEIDVQDLKCNTEYQGYSASSPVIANFWRCVDAMSQEELAKLIQFTTGTAKVPLEGFAALEGMSGPQKFQIHKAYGAPERLPTAHTCFNQLDLPEYETYEELCAKLNTAVGEAHVGFGFV